MSNNAGEFSLKVENHDEDMVVVCNTDQHSRCCENDLPFSEEKEFTYG